MTTYRAPWSGLLKAVSLGATLSCWGAAIVLIGKMGYGETQWYLIGTGIFLLALPFGCALLTVRGYSLTADEILVRRLFWTTRLPRAGLVSATVVPRAMRRSIRLWGNGGFYSFTGWFWNRELRSYRAFVTDQGRTVVVRFEHRTIVVSPDSPEDFVQALA